MRLAHMLDKLWTHKIRLLTAAASAAAYENWEPEFAVKEVRSAWKGEGLKTTFKVTVEDLRMLPEKDRSDLGIGSWDGVLMLIPLWMFPLIADGETLTGISGEEKVIGKDYIDLDIRFGCIAWGYTI